MYLLTWKTTYWPQVFLYWHEHIYLLKNRWLHRNGPTEARFVYRRKAGLPHRHHANESVCTRWQTHSTIWNCVEERKRLTCRIVIRWRCVRSGMEPTAPVGFRRKMLKRPRQNVRRRLIKQADVEKRVKASSWAPRWYGRCQNGRCCICSLPSGRRGWLFFISLLMRHDGLSKLENGSPMQDKNVFFLKRECPVHLD